MDRTADQGRAPGWARFGFPIALALAALVGYGRSFSGPFVFDDPDSIAGNPTIRHLWPIAPVLSPPYDQGQTVGGRPMLNLSLAVNYAISGTEVWSYHGLNLAIHICAALALFGILRRTFERIFAARSGLDESGVCASRLAFAASLLWTVHPLQTESVTYVVQRAESMMGMFYLFTMYCFIRYAEGDGGRAGGPSFVSALTGEPMPPLAGGVPDEALAKSGAALLRRSGGGSVRHPRVAADLRAAVVQPATPLPLPGGRRPPSKPTHYRRSWFSSSAWAGLSIFFCLLGMATKEVMVSAPVIVFLYDRTFVSGSFREAWRRHRFVHAGLAATWIFLGILIWGARERGGTSGLGLGISWGGYVLTQASAILHYLRLAAWPHPLVFDYGAEWINDAWTAVPAWVVVGGLMGVGAYLMLGRPVRLREGFGGQAAGFAAAWFFAVLAPSSLVPGIRQTVAEHRMYLALAPVVAVAVAVVGFCLNPRGRTAAGFALLPLAGVTVAFIGLTLVRNRDYRSELALWQDTVLKRPQNPYAQNNLGYVLQRQGRLGEARARFADAVRLKPDYPEADNNLGNRVRADGRPAESLAYFQRALRLRPRYAEAYNNLGVALADLGRASEAISAFDAALALKPNYPEACYNLGNVLADTGRLSQAIAAYDAALRLMPDLLEVRMNLGNALARTGRIEEAIAQYRVALRRQPNNPDTHYNFGNTLVLAGKYQEAIDEYMTALRLRPDFEQARVNIERVRAMAAASK